MRAEPPLILVVDDQLGVRRLIQEVFHDAGFRVVPAPNGQEALTLAAVNRPSLVLLDMKMPVMDGLETLRALRTTYPDLIVLMMTAVGDGEQVQEALSLGAKACLSKPFDVFQLRARVEAFIREERRI
jgi:two-component system response regulator (stage 0 sporulation protein F)